MTEPHTTEEALDLALAAELQAALLPARCPQDLGDHFAAARNRMCGTVGGDFYDFIRLNRDQLAIAIGDVVGHGVRAGLMMTQIMGYLRSVGRGRSRPAAVIAGLNRMLLDLGDRAGTVTSCTLFYAVLDTPSGICFYVNAGHPPPILWADGAARPVGAHEMLLGAEDYVPAEQCYTFTAGQRLVLYTDGIIEAADGDEERFGTRRLCEHIAEAEGVDAEMLAGRVFTAVDAFSGQAPASDDQTVVVLDRR
ncbi:MAG: PP2C family protein-serine/threonine phosphatase [Phycisphaerae bacterium]|nr:PP2C family protein-serine/threonine phosphatase [Phycisphaerae bacterium]